MNTHETLQLTDPQTLRSCAETAAPATKGELQTARIINGCLVTISD